jgi:hypothetical protein
MVKMTSVLPAVAIVFPTLALTVPDVQHIRQDGNSKLRRQRLGGAE